MKKWFLLLAFALLFNTVCARAEGELYYTSNHDRYYHLDANCDRPAGTNWWDDTPVSYYEREIYRKYEISETAALEFQKKACPVCVKQLKPVYLGEHMPEWNFDVEPWEINGMSYEEEDALRKARPEDFHKEIVDTAEAFDAYFEQSYNHETDQFERKHDYPAFYAGRYATNSGCSAHLLVDFNDEMLAAFKKMFGGGAWIVPAKYGYDEIYNERERVFQELIAWCNAHPELDAQAVSAGGPDYENYAVIGISGADWQLAAAAMEETAPIYIHFTYEESLSFV